MYLPTTHQHMTAVEFATLPEGPPYFQLVEGTLYFMASPSIQHQAISMALGSRIYVYLLANPIGKVFAAPSDVTLDEVNVFEPDLYFVSTERAGIFTRQGVAGAPDLVVEILSPSTLRLDRELKRGIYFRAGVRELWFVLPDRQRVEVYGPESGGEGEPARTVGVGDVLETPLLPGWSVSVAELFA